MLLTDARTARVLITVLLFALGLGFLYVARATLIAFLFAIFFAYLMSPLVNRLEVLLRGRVAAIAVIYALLLVLVVVFFVVVGPKVTREGARLGQSLPALLTQLSSGQIARQLGAEHGAGGGQNRLLLAQSLQVNQGGADHQNWLRALGCVWPMSLSRPGCSSWSLCFPSSS